MLKSSKLLKIIVIWFIVNTTVVLIIFSILSAHSTAPASTLFWATMISVHVISYLPTITGYFLGQYLKKKPLITALPLTLAGTLCAAIIGSRIGFQLTRYLFNYPVLQPPIDYSYKMLIPVLIITFIVTIILTILDRLKDKKEELEKNLEDIKSSIKKDSLRNQSALSVKEDESYHVIKHDDLIYLVSHGKKTTFHTREKDYVTNQLLKDIEKKLPAENFIRIHKQFVVNTKYLSRIKYYEGGRYMAYLKDDDESALPVGRKIVPFLKEKLGIIS